MIQDPKKLIKLQPKDIERLYSIKRGTVYRLLQKMQASPKYSHGYTSISHNLKLIDRAIFEEFLASLNDVYLKEGY